MTGTWQRIAAVIVVLSAAMAIWAQTAPGPAAPAAGTGQTAAPTGQTVAPVVASGPEQPIPFSHKVHAGTLQLVCESCHILSRSGETLAIPQTATCMACHQTMVTADPGVQKLAAYAKSGSIIPWVRVYQLPSFVTFSHKMHITHGNTCQECHGQVAERDRLFKESDISMAGCLNCHRTKKASIDCNTCHMLEQ